MDFVITRRRSVAVALVCLIFVVLGLLRLNEASSYTPDSTRYLIWGNSLAHGQGIVDNTGPMPDRFVVHMPLYAFILAPLEVFIPLSFIAAKVWTLMWGACALLLFFIWVRKHYGFMAALL